METETYTPVYTQGIKLKVEVPGYHNLSTGLHLPAYSYITNIIEEAHAAMWAGNWLPIIQQVTETIQQQTERPIAMWRWSAKPMEFEIFPEVPQPTSQLL